jgi:hypothetical protein
MDRDTTAVLLFILAIVVLFIIIEQTPKVIHLVSKGHFPEYKKIEGNEYDFDTYTRECERCNHA